MGKLETQAIMDNKIVSTTYVPLQSPYQVIKYDQDVAMQIGTLIVTIQKGEKDYQIETHSHPVVAYENKHNMDMADEQLTEHQFLEGAVWNNVEVRDVTTICLTGATLTWQQFLEILEHDSMLHAYRSLPDAGLYWHLNKLGIKVLPPKERECTVLLSLRIQPEEAGLSLQSELSSQLFLNVPIAEDEEEVEHVFYDKEKSSWDSDVLKKDKDVLLELSAQIHAYRWVLRDLLFEEDMNHFTVTYATDDERFQKIVDQLNNTDYSVNLAYIS